MENSKQILHPALQLLRVTIITGMLFVITIQFVPTSVAFGLFAMATGAIFIVLILLSVRVTWRALRG